MDVGRVNLLLTTLALVQDYSKYAAMKQVMLAEMDEIEAGLVQVSATALANPADQAPQIVSVPPEAPEAPAVAPTPPEAMEMPAAAPVSPSSAPAPTSGASGATGPNDESDTPLQRRV